jgi:lipopolysaccharide biosynthesis regulator YciM
MKKRYLVSFISFFVFVLSVGHCFAQQTLLPADPANVFRQANLFFQSKNFYAAREGYIQYLAYLQNKPEEFTAERTQVAYYIAMCSIYTMRPEAELQAIRFVSDHPESPYAALLKREIGVFYYETGDWVRAIRYLKQAAQTNLEHTYYLAISYYQVKQYDEALALFNELKLESEEEYAIPAAYYAGVMHYRAGAYDESIDDFRLAAKDPTYGPEIPQWISAALIKQGKISELESFIEPILADTTGKYHLSALASVLAEKQFANGQYAKAARNFKILSTTSKAKLSRMHTFKWAYSLHKSNEDMRALSLLTSIRMPADSLGQEILQVQADIYLILNKVKERLETLEAISALPFNPILVENAFIARLEILKDAQAWSELLNELKKYPPQFSQPEKAEMLVDLALSVIKQTNNLIALKDFMENYPVGKAKFQALYQFLMYEKGAQFYAANDQKQAITFLRHSLEYPINQEMAWHARYGQAEILARNNKNSDAIKIYMSLLAETTKSTGSPELSQRIRLSLAQSFTYIAMYDRAQSYFEEYLGNKKAETKTPQDFGNAAETAIANGQVNAGLAYFDQAIALGKTGSDIFVERKATVLFNERRFEEAYQEYVRLSSFALESPRRDANVYKSHMALYRSQNNLRSGELVASLTRFIEQSDSSNMYMGPSLLIRGQVYESLNQPNLALNDYMRIVRKTNVDSTVKDALVGASEILLRTGRGEEIFELREIYASLHGEEKGEDQELFDLCQSIFESGKYRTAVAALVKFASKYPKFTQSAEVDWMLGFSTFQTKDWANSMTYLRRVVLQDKPEGKKAEALWLMASIESLQKNTEAAVSYIIELLSKKNPLDLQVKATEKLLALYAETDQLAKADAVLSAISDSNEKNRLMLELGNHWLGKQNANKAEIYWTRLVQEDTTDIGAQALILIATQLTKSEDYKGSTELIKQYFSQEGARYFSASEAWVGKAYLLMADNFIALKNGRQAKIILESILTSTSDESIRQQANKKLEELTK